jgi:hypothetical protein
MLGQVVLAEVVGGGNEVRQPAAQHQQPCRRVQEVQHHLVHWIVLRGRDVVGAALGVDFIGEAALLACLARAGSDAWVCRWRVIACVIVLYYGTVSGVKALCMLAVP